MTAPVDFTDCPRLPGRAYNGANGKKIAVSFDFLASSEDPGLAAARARIVQRIDPAAFAALVDETPYLTDLQRTFYKTYFAARAAALFGVS